MASCPKAAAAESISELKKKSACCSENVRPTSSSPSYARAFFDKGKREERVRDCKSSSSDRKDFYILAILMTAEQRLT